jgi:hypothetical protein
MKKLSSKQLRRYVKWYQLYFSCGSCLLCRRPDELATGTGFFFVTIDLHTYLKHTIGELNGVY